jgi:hypothetical protein
MKSMRLSLVALAFALLLAGCGGSVAERAGAPRGAAPAELAPADAALYVGVVTDADSAEWQRVETLLARFPDADRLLSDIAGELGGQGVDWERDVKPALGPLTALVQLPRSGDAIALTKPPLRAKLDALLGRADRKVATTSLDDGWVAIAEHQATLDAYTNALDGPRLADDDDFADAVAELPADALATIFVRPEAALAVGGLSSGWSAYAPTAASSGFEWLGAALTAEDDGLALDGTARLDDAPESYEPTLLRRVPAGVVLAVSFHGADRAFEQLQSGGLGHFLPSIDDVLGVPLQDVLDVLKGQGVLYVRPGLPVPEVTLGVDTDDGAAAAETVDRIARKLAGSFETIEVDGVTAHAVRLDKVQLVWTALDDTLFVSTGANALRDFRSDDAKLADDSTFGRAADRVGLGDETAGFVYVDAARLAELVDGLAGLEGANVPQELGRNLAAIEFLAANGTTDGDDVRLRGFLSVPDR